MKKIFTSTLLLTLLLGFSLQSKAGPISGSISIPNPTYGNLDAAIADLNAFGVAGAGPVTITLNQNDSSLVGGYVLGSSVLYNSLNSTRTLTIVGSTAAGKTLTAHVGSGSNDAIFIIKGMHYITINKLHLIEKATNTTSTSMMEKGYSLVKLNTDTACASISITNCNITLNNTNTTGAAGISPNGSVGIYVGNCLANSTTALGTSVMYEGGHDGFFFSNNNITNVNHGIYLYGIPLNADGTAYNDKNATIQGNTISNFTHNGISLSFFNGDLVKANTINNMTGGGVAPTTNNIFGVRYVNTAGVVTNTSWTCSDNNINLTINCANTYMCTGILTQLNGTGNTTIQSDTIQLTSSGASAQLNGIFSQNLGGTQLITQNLLRNFTTQTTNALAVIGIFGGGYSTYTTIGMTNLNSYPATSTISKNVITNFNVCSSTGVTANQVMAILEDNFTTAPSTISDNTVSNITINNNSQRFLGYGGIWNYGSFISAPIFHTTTFTGNTFTGITTSGATNSTPVYIVAPVGTYPNGHTLSCINNRIKNITSSLGILVGFSVESGLTTTLDKDTLTDLTSSSWHVIGVLSGNTAYATKNISLTNSLFKNFASNAVTGGTLVVGAYILPGTTTQTATYNVANNILNNFTNTDTMGFAHGIFTNGGTGTYTVSNNMISDIAATADTSQYCSSFGLNLSNTGTNNITYNTIKMVTSLTANKQYGATGIRYNAAATNTIQNNISHVNVVAGTLNNVAAIRGVSGAPTAAPTIGGFTAASNIYYAPNGPSNYLYVDGTTNITLVNGYAISGLTANASKNIVNDTFFNSKCGRSSYHNFMQSAVATREVNTFNENNLTGAAGVFAPTGMSFAESAGKDGSVITDFSGTTRPFGSSDIGAAEFAGTTFPVMNITVTSSTGLDSACAYFLPSLTATVPSSFTRLSFQWYRDTTKIPGATFKTVTVSAVSAKYTFKVYDSATGCTYSSTPFPITIVPLPPAQITYYDSLIFCESSAVVLYANKGYKYTYQWKRNGVGMIGETNDHYVASKSGDYSVEVNTPFGCAVTSTYIRVKVYPLPKPTVIYGGPRMLTTQKYYTYQWYMNGKKIDSFALNRIYYTFADAAYQVEVTDSNGCTAKSDVYLYSLGINDNAVASSIKIYPNPTSGQIHIESPIDLNIRLTDLTGRTIVDKVNNGIVDITNLADGMYLINISDKDGNLIKVEKISKTK